MNHANKTALNSLLNNPLIPIDPEVVVIVVVDCSIRGVGWRREIPLNHPLDPLKIQGAI